jgi:hypothetical protein
VGLTLLTERYAPQIAGVLSCSDRILLFGTLPKICFAEGMASYCSYCELKRNMTETGYDIDARGALEITFVHLRWLAMLHRISANSPDLPDGSPSG